MTPPDLHAALLSALQLEARRDYSAAADILDEAAKNGDGSPALLRFRVLLLRADLAVNLDDLGTARGVLSEARQIRLTAGEKDALDAELRRADDLEVFLTHRGCAG
jgi:hypothetical protein